jgi:GNAT superfamily N-acetyltransferase
MAAPEDVPRLADLRREWTLEDGYEEARTRAEFDQEFVALVSEGIESARWVVWLAEVDGEIASHAFVGVVDRIPRPIEQLSAIGYLTNVYTRPDHRGRGIGSGVLDAVTAWARETGIAVLFVWPSEASVAHYERHGFAARGEPLVWLHPEAGD